MKKILDKKVRLFTDNDLDGVGCAVLLKLTHERIKIHNVARAEDKDHILKSFCYNKDLYNKTDKIFMTDISVSVETIKELRENLSDFDDKFTLLDHHPTAKELNQFPCCKVEDFTSDSEEHKTCGTRMVFDYLIEEGILPKNKQKMIYLKEFVKVVRKYDTWEWKETNYKLSMQLNELYTVYGFNEFLNLFVERLENKSFHMTDNEKFLLDIREIEVQRYCRQQLPKVKECIFNGHKGGFVFAEQNTSFLGNFLSEKLPKYQFILIINLNRKSCSLRTVKDDFNCLDIAKAFNGGGHRKACGFDVSEIKEFIANNL